MIRNQAGQVAAGQVINATTGAGFAGAVTVYVTVDGGVQALGTVGAGVCAAEGNGLFTYVPSAAETNGASVSFTFIGTGAVPATTTYDTLTAAQNQAIQAATGTGVVSVETIVADAFMDLNVFGASQSRDPYDMAVGLGKLNIVLDDLNASRNGVYRQAFSAFTLTPALAPHTIGPTGTWVTTQRPVTIDGAELLIGNGITQPIDTDHDWQWYQSLSQKELSTAYPTDLYYDPAWPNGNIYFYPVPSSALVVTLSARVVLAQVVLTDSFWMPPGYRSAVTKTLGEELAAGPYRKQLSERYVEMAREARARVSENNTIIPSLITNDSGMPGSGGGFFNYRTRQWDGSRR